MRTEPVGTEIDCSSCNDRFIKHAKHGRVCKPCLLQKQRERRRLTGNNATKKYEKTKKGFLMRAYRNMESRVRGIQRDKCTSHYGQPILPRQTFYEWSLNNPDFHDLFEAWEKENYRQAISPSVDRIDPRFGYELWNMQWVTLGENVRRGAAFTYHGKII